MNTPLISPESPKDTQTMPLGTFSSSKKELHPPGRLWKKISQLPANLYLLLIRVCTAVKNVFIFSTQASVIEKKSQKIEIENLKSVDINEHRKKLGKIYMGIGNADHLSIKRSITLKFLQYELSQLSESIQKDFQNLKIFTIDFNKENKNKHDILYSELNQISTEINDLQSLLNSSLSFNELLKPLNLSEDQEKKLKPILDEFISTELIFVNGMKKIILYKGYFDDHSDEEIINQTGINFDINDLKNIREYLNNVESCCDVNSDFYSQIKNIASDNSPEKLVKIFLQHDFQAVFQNIGSKYEKLLKSTQKGDVKKLFTILQSTLEPSEKNKNSLLTLFLTPIQRVPRYMLLFRDLLKEAKKADLDELQLAMIKIGLNQADNIAHLMNRS